MPKQIEPGDSIKVLHGIHAGKFGEVLRLEGRWHAVVSLRGQRVLMALASLELA